MTQALRPPIELIDVDLAKVPSSFDGAQFPGERTPFLRQVLDRAAIRQDHPGIAFVKNSAVDMEGIAKPITDPTKRIAESKRNRHFGRSAFWRIHSRALAKILDCSGRGCVRAWERAAQPRRDIPRPSSTRFNYCSAMVFDRRFQGIKTMCQQSKNLLKSYPFHVSNTTHFGINNRDLRRIGHKTSPVPEKRS